MPAYGYEGGAWQPCLNIHCYTDGEWQLVRGAWKYVSGAWEQFYSNHNYQLYALGDVQTVYPAGDHGLYMDGQLVFAGARSYNIVLFDNYGNITGTQTFDVFGDNGATGTGTATQNMINYMNGLTAGQIYLIFTFDEPQTGASNLTSTFTSFFGGTASIVSGSMPYRCAYYAMGKKGAAPWIEKYCGTEESNFTGPGGATVTGTPDGVFNITFQVYTASGPSGSFVNLNTLYVGSALVSNASETGTSTVAGIATS
jgi:hypothetical protein